MAEKPNAVATTGKPNLEKLMELGETLNKSVSSVLGQEGMVGFQKAYQIADAIEQLQALLTPEYMRPIMALQGNRLGFKTDKDDAGGYPENIVKNCLIEAVLTGVQPFGNQFNIIASNMYLTKEGFGYLLKRTPLLSEHEIIPALPRINADKTSAAIVMNIMWKRKATDAVRETRQIDMPIRMNLKMGTDAVIGKGTRKARAWLFNTIHGTEIADGDAVDTTAEVVDTKIMNQDVKSGKVQGTMSGLFDGDKKPEAQPGEQAAKKAE